MPSPVANRLLVQLQDRGDFRHGHKVIGLGHQPTLLRLADLVNVVAGFGPLPGASRAPPERGPLVTSVFVVGLVIGLLHSVLRLCQREALAIRRRELVDQALL